MAADSKVILFAVVGIVIGAAIGVGVGYMCWHSDVGEQTYWFYIDYGTAADDSHVNGWVSVKSTSAADAIKKVPGAELKGEGSEMYLDGINGVVGNNTPPYVYWAVYIVNGDYYSLTDFEKEFSYSNMGFGNAYSTVFYLAYGDGSIPTNADWKGTGPFAS